MTKKFLKKGVIVFLILISFVSINSSVYAAASIKLSGSSPVYSGSKFKTAGGYLYIGYKAGFTYKYKVFTGSRYNISKGRYIYYKGGKKLDYQFAYATNGYNYYFRNGMLYTGIHNNRYYKNGRPSSGLYNSIYYNAQGRPFTGSRKLRNSYICRYYNSKGKYMGYKRRNKVYYKNGRRVNSTVYSTNQITTYSDGKVIKIRYR